MLETYKKLVDFLGLILGEHCKIVLFDLRLSPPTVVAIANGTMAVSYTHLDVYKRQVLMGTPRSASKISLASTEFKR